MSDFNPPFLKFKCPDCGYEFEDICKDSTVQITQSIQIRRSKNPRRTWDEEPNDHPDIDWESEYAAEYQCPHCSSGCYGLDEFIEEFSKEKEQEHEFKPWDIARIEPEEIFGQECIVISKPDRDGDCRILRKNHSDGDMMQCFVNIRALTFLRHGGDPLSIDRSPIKFEPEDEWEEMNDE